MYIVHTGERSKILLVMSLDGGEFCWELVIFVFYVLTLFIF